MSRDNNQAFACFYQFCFLTVTSLRPQAATMFAIFAEMCNKISYNCRILFRKLFHIFQSRIEPDSCMHINILSQLVSKNVFLFTQSVPQSTKIVESREDLIHKKLLRLERLFEDKPNLFIKPMLLSTIGKVDWNL